MLVVQLVLVMVTFALVFWGQRVVLELEIVETAELMTLAAAHADEA